MSVSIHKCQNTDNIEDKLGRVHLYLSAAAVAQTSKIP